MKKIVKTIFTFGVCAALLNACGDMLETGSSRVVFEEDNTLQSANDTVYSVMGILELMEYVGNRYVILGELRGDLVDVTPNSDVNLQQINNFEVSATNPYATTREYYQIINNCNYFLAHADTTIISGGVYTMLNEYGIVKTIRAWTYLQLAINYGKAVYIDKPITSLAEMDATYPTLDRDQLIDKLIADIEPFINLTMPSYAPKGFVPPAILLGDLYLWKGDYANAAKTYFSKIYQDQILLSGIYRSVWIDESFTERSPGYRLLFTESSDEIIAEIQYGTDYGMSPDLFPLVTPVEAYTSTFIANGIKKPTYELVYSQVAENLWATQMYSFYTTTRTLKYVPGDLRGPYGAYDKYPVGADSIPYIYKLSSSAYMTTVPIYRTATMYLRYAEAINQLGYPSTAFALLKYGLNSTIYTDATILPEREKTDVPDYVSGWSESRFATNTSIRERGLGSPRYDTIYYKIPELETLQDSILYVDDMICQELALETAFEGNRFPDLMRFALRRGDPAYLADKVGRKNPAVREKLMNTANWYLPWSE
jgi:hypothetical protein